MTVRLINAPPRQGPASSREVQALYEWTVRLTDLINENLAQIALSLPSFTVATVPDASNYESRMIYVSDESGGAVPAFSDGTDWRRVTDRAIIS